MQYYSLIFWLLQQITNVETDKGMYVKLSIQHMQPLLMSKICPNYLQTNSFLKAGNSFTENNSILLSTCYRQNCFRWINYNAKL